MLTFLHTAPLHVETFGLLARQIDESVPVRHVVRTELLAMALGPGACERAVQSAVGEAVRELASEGAKVVVCTCSTLGRMAEAAVVADCTVLRIDRPVAEVAVTSGRRILLVAALPTALQQTFELLRQVAADRRRSPEIVTSPCERAWRSFEVGDVAGYLAEVAESIEVNAAPGDLVLLAQASMAPVAELVRRADISIVSSPRTGVQAAFSALRRLTS